MILAVHCVTGEVTVRSTLYGPAAVNTMLVGVCAVDVFGLAVGPKNQVKFPLAGNELFVNAVNNPTHELLALKSGIGKVLIVIRLLTVSLQEIFIELVPTTVKVTRYNPGLVYVV